MMTKFLSPRVLTVFLFHPHPLGFRVFLQGIIERSTFKLIMIDLVIKGTIDLDILYFLKEILDFLRHQVSL